MPLSCDAARRMLADALRSRMATRSLAQVLVSLHEVFGRATMLSLLDEFDGVELMEAKRLAQSMLDSESSWEIPTISQRPPKAPGGLAGRVRKHG